jgi:ubiquinone/menaquinone biosynthesis C-methylase UbiE
MEPLIPPHPRGGPIVKSSGTNASCEALILQAPRVFEALQIFVQRSLPLLPADISLASLTHVLDVGCGRHLWGRALFHAMLEQAGPDLIADVRIDGIEICHEIVQAARTTLRTAREQVLISQGNLLNLPAESENRYQLVHMRFLALSLPPFSWSQALAQLYRVCAPGGTVIWLEPSLPTPSDKALGWNQWLRWIAQAVATQGGSPSIDQSMDAIFQQAGPWMKLHREIIPVPLLPPTRIQGSLLPDQLQTLSSWIFELRPWLEQSGIPANQLAKGLSQVLDELNSRRIISTWPWTVMTGTKPTGRR